jgi:signal transduction histidine kinase
MSLYHLNTDIHAEINEIHKTYNKPIQKILNFFNNNSSQFENYYFYNLGSCEYTNSFSNEKFYFNIFLRKVQTESTVWVEVMMYDITQNKKIEAADEMIKMKEKVLSKIAHEFKTPLICVIALSEEIQNSLKNKLSYDEDIFNIKRKIRHVNDLSNYILFLISDIAQYLNRQISSNNSLLNPGQVNNTTSQLYINIQETPILEILNFSYRILKTLLVYNKNKIQFIKPKKIYSKDIEENNLEIKTDPLRVKQILLNLISNAVKFTQYGVISVEAKIKDHYLIFVVSDTGIGISSEDLSKIFQDYKMLEEHLNFNQMGSGLGLSISHHIAKFMGYDLKVKSKPGVGSKFYIIIDLLRECGERVDNKSKLRGYKVAKYFKSTPLLNLKNYQTNSEDFKKMQKHVLDIPQNKNLPKTYEYMNQLNKCKSQSLKQSAILKNCTNNEGAFFNHSSSHDKKKNSSLFKKSEQMEHHSCQNPPYYQQIKDEVLTKETDYKNDKEKKLKFQTSKNLFKKKNQEFFKAEESMNPKSIVSFTRESSVSSRGSTKTLPRQNFNFNMSTFNILKNNTNNRKTLSTISISFPSEPEKLIISFDKEQNQKIDKKILLIDDNSLLLDYLQNMIIQILRENELTDYSVVRGYDGVDLLKYIIDDQKENNLIKLAFVDENMEFIKGSHAIHILKKLERENKIKPTPFIKFSCDEVNVITEEDFKGMSIPKPPKKSDLLKIFRSVGIIKN